MTWETVTGLEIHAELKTKSKLFCGCSSEFGGEPNTRCCSVCTGMPGALPVVNKKAVKLCITAGLGLNCDINNMLIFDRKNYFYPDLPRGYQISQLYEPLCKNGFLEISGGKKIRIREIHLEDDAGKLIHDKYEGKSCCDFNRCGVPLIEIVTEPDFTSAEEVGEFIKELRKILLFLRVSDCKMQEGSMRVDVNLSVRKKGEKSLGTRTEIKNLNSVRAIMNAMESERKRQTEIISYGGAVVQETRRYDEKTGETVSMRKKEEQSDYRYFPEPDITPVNISRSLVDEIRRNMPDLPAKLCEKYAKLNISPENIQVITSNPFLAEYFKRVIELGAEPKTASNRLVVEVMGMLNEYGGEEIPIPPEKFVKILDLTEKGVISRAGSKEVLKGVFKENTEVEEYIESHDLWQNVSEDRVLNEAERIIAENPDAVADYKSGKEKALGFLMGQCMKALKGKGNPDVLRKMLIEEMRGVEEDTP